MMILELMDDYLFYYIVGLVILFCYEILVGIKQKHTRKSSAGIIEEI